MSQKKSQEEDTLGRNLTLTPVGPERVKWQEVHYNTVGINEYESISRRLSVSQI